MNIGGTDQMYPERIQTVSTCRYRCGQMTIPLLLMDEISIFAKPIKVAANGKR
jgi:hypothetical protein